MAKKTTRTVHRSAVTGRFVKPSTAAKNPRTTVKETIKPSPKKTK